MIIKIKQYAIVLMTFCYPCLAWPLNLEDERKIGKQIWYNEASGKRDLLVFWNPNESFPSLGIGHNIWLPENSKAPYTQEFPSLCRYLERHGVQLPLWLECVYEKGASWQTREEFLQDTVRLEELRVLLERTVELQTRFMIERLDRQMSLIMQAASQEQKAHVQKMYDYMTSSLLGIYALVDYLNFKGSGLNSKENDQGYYWGLMYILLDMPIDTMQENAPQAFSVAAAKRLIMLIQLSAPSYRRLKFMRGWINRIATYADPAVFI